MNLLTKIYLAFGFILVVFTFVTVSFIRQSKEIDKDTQAAINSTEVLRVSEGLEKAIVDSETGLRGFQISDNEAFLDPYYKGLLEFDMRMAELKQLIKDQEQLKQLAKIDSSYAEWQATFSEPSITLQRAALKSANAKQAYQEFLEDRIKSGAGKKIIDHIRQLIAGFDEREQMLKKQNLQDMNATLRFTRNLAIMLTIGSILIGLAVIITLGNTISNRLKAMVAMAGEVANGHFNVKISDNSQDEISKVTDSLNTMADRLNTSFTDLQKMNRELDQFAYVVSHDLKAPLRAINNLAEWIQEDLTDPDPDIQRNLELMRGRVLRMENLINGILDYSKIGRKKLPKTTFEVQQLISEIKDSVVCNSAVSIEIENSLPRLTTEKILLEQVFTNFISNAIKYNDKPVPQVKIGCHTLNNWVEFYVEDNGPGIPKEFHNKVFGVFQTMEARDTKESTGIGLAIVKKIIDEKGGQIRLDSEEGKGCRFTFSWPIEMVLTKENEFATTL
ncbi:ATP-binding protein [Pontibacter sp. SGAir0037]|uniref:sensor histidine kinase n=1 Tax=Pontibacter sp. SGAir0037 TaxID=2571030 RepID=UPI0010CD2DFF|nr:ATP-binding protein [Pontibacter sp. SGAir0037]QCR22988.1 hypothetical protein C1N53_11970 [Pontibacter sp. SGAir0037]